VKDEAVAMRVVALDHVVIYSANVDQTIDFYTTVLGMKHVVFDSTFHALHFGEQKINIHDASAPFSPHAARTDAGGLDLCLLTDTPIFQVVEHLRAHNVRIIEGPCEQVGAQGPIMSIYFNDPDGNLIEVASYTGLSAKSTMV
jgi:catechol 2,3-dioxygenase-like lactoylglutathione lyase family enzyme